MPGSSYKAFAVHRILADTSNCYPQLGSLSPLAPSGLRPGGFFFPGGEWTGRDYEEKETDIAISMKPIEFFAMDRADTAVLVRWDTDLAPAVRTAATRHRTRPIPVVQPCGQLVDGSGCGR